MPRHLYRARERGGWTLARLLLACPRLTRAFRVGRLYCGLGLARDALPSDRRRHFSCAWPVLASALADQRGNRGLPERERKNAIGQNCRKREEKGEETESGVGMCANPEHSGEDASALDETDL